MCIWIKWIGSDRIGSDRIGSSGSVDRWIGGSADRSDWTHTFDCYRWYDRFFRIASVDDQDDRNVDKSIVPSIAIQCIALVHCALCIVHCALCIVHCALCIVHEDLMFSISSHSTRVW
jgi:hypothetical protein